MPVDERNELALYAALSITMIIWGSSFVFSKYVLTTTSPLTYMAVRFSIAALLFILIFLRVGTPSFRPEHRLLVFFTAFAEPILYFIFESYGLERTTATKASLIIATIPVMVLVAARVFLGERMSLRTVLSVAISFLGIGLVVLGDPTVSIHRPETLVGDLLVFGAVLSASGYITLSRHLSQRYRPIHVTGMQIVYGAVAFDLLWIFQSPERRIPHLDGYGWSAIAFLAVGATIIAFLLYNHSLSRVSAGHAALFINSIPVITAITAWIVLGERLTPIQLAGAIFVVAAVLWNRNPVAPKVIEV